MSRIVVLLLLVAVSGCGRPPPAHEAKPCASAGPAGAVEVAATLTDGRAAPAPHRVPVPVNGVVRLTVTADRPVEVHVHGYDLAYQAEPGVPACVTFTAGQAGLFDVEAHPDTLLVQLEVR
jgi:hypothetical protein